MKMHFLKETDGEEQKKTEERFSGRNQLRQVIKKMIVAAHLKETTKAHHPKKNKKTKTQICRKKRGMAVYLKGINWSSSEIN